MDNKPLSYSDLDRNVLVWGNAVDGRVTATGFGWEGHDRADAQWDPDDESTGEIAYYHPDLGWTNSAMGRGIEEYDDREER